MFVVSDITKLRVYVNVPQNYVPAIRIGAKAVLTMPEYPNRTFAATVEASSQSVDVSSGTTRMQLALDNAGGELMPGGYASVRLPLLRDACRCIFRPARSFSTRAAFGSRPSVPTTRCCSRR